MTFIKRILVQMVLAWCCLTLAVYAQSTDSSPTPSAVSADDGFDTALKPLYRMTNGFIKVVFPKLRFDTISKVLDAVTEGNAQPWPLTQTILNGYAGFATSVVVGVLLIVLMPFIGCFCCCCRLCNKCGGQTHEMDPKNAKCKRLLCGGLLLVFTLITIGGMVMIFFSGARIHDLIDKGIIDEQLNQELNGLGSLLQNKVDQDIVNRTDDLLDNLQAKVETFLDESGKKLSSAFLNITDVEGPVTNLAKALTDFNSSLLLLVDSLEDFETLRKTTAVNYTAAETLINGTTTLHPAAKNSAMAVVGRLTNAIEGFSLQQVVDLLGDNATSKLNNIPDLEKAYKVVNSSISGLIEKKIQQPKDDILREVNATIATVSGQVNDVGRSSRQIVTDIQNQGDVISSSLESGKVYASYVWYACLTMGNIVALIVLLYLCGVMYGCGSRPGDASCHKGIGANCILAAVGFTFIFFSLLMLLTTTLFSVGSLTSTHLCLVIQEPGPQITTLVDNDISIPGAGNLTLHSILRTYSDCLEGQTLEQISSYIDLGFDKNDLVRQIDDKLGYEEISKQINNINIDVGNITFLPQDLDKALQGLKSFDGFNDTIVPDLTNDVDTVKNLLNNSIVSLNTLANLSSTSVPDGDSIRAAGEYFTHSRDTGLDSMVNMAASIKSSVARLSTILSTLQNASQEAVDSITNVETRIKNNASTIVKEILSQYARQLSDEVKKDANAGINQLFGTKCDDLANQLRNTANVVCETGLDPFNGLWFSLGWSLIMLLPCMITGLVLASLYRRRSSYDGDYKDDLNRDYDSEHIPLESRHKPRYHGDVANQGFRDDYGYDMRSGGGYGDSYERYHRGMAPEINYRSRGVKPAYY